MKFVTLLVVGIAALSVSACEKQPLSKLELMESPFRHEEGAEGHGHKQAVPSASDTDASQKATQ